MIESSMMINDRMPEYCMERSSNILNRYKKSLNGSQILVLGVAYKQDIDDYRESPALVVIDVLKSMGAEVKFFDPYIAEYRYKGESYSGEKNLSKELLANADLVLVTAAHTNVDYDFVQQNSVFIFDTKNAMKSVKNRENIELL